MEKRSQKEIFKPIVGYEGLYEVSNYGRVRSLPRRCTKGKVLKPGLVSGGYCGVVLSKDGKCSSLLVHRLVADAFIPNPEGLIQINHKDENKANNCIDNLEWCTAQYNSEYSKAIPIAQLSLNGKILGIFKSAREVERKMGFKHQLITNCCKGAQNTSYKYKWKYYKDYASN